MKPSTKTSLKEISITGRHGRVRRLEKDVVRMCLKRAGCTKGIGKTEPVQIKADTSGRMVTCTRVGIKGVSGMGRESTSGMMDIRISVTGLIVRGVGRG